MSSIAKLLRLLTKHISLHHTYPDVIDYTAVTTPTDGNGNAHWLGATVTVTVTNKAATDINLTVTDHTLTIDRSYDNVLRKYTFVVHIPLNTSVDITTYQFNIICSTGTTKQFNVLQQGMLYIHLPDSLNVVFINSSLPFSIVKQENGDGASEITYSGAKKISLDLDVPTNAHSLVTLTNYSTSNCSGVTEVSRTTNANGTLHMEIQLNRTDDNFNSIYGIRFAYGDVHVDLVVTQWAHVDALMKPLASPVVNKYVATVSGEQGYATVKTIELLPGIYKFECWGAAGGNRTSSGTSGKGGYSVGTYTTNTKLKITIVAGCIGFRNSTAANGMPHNGGKGYRSYQNGGDASWICIGDTDDVYARVIVAGGGGSCGATNKSGGYGGGLSGESKTENYGSGGFGGTQTGVSDSNCQTTTRPTSTTDAAGVYAGFGFGGNGIYRSEGYGGAGGGGWYGGVGVYPDGSGDDDRGGGGGSGYVYTKDTATNYPSGCKLTSAHYLTDAQTIAGNSTMPDRDSDGTITGNASGGCVRITKTHEYVEAHSEDIPMPERLSYILNTGNGAIHLTNWYPSSQDYSISFDVLNGTQVGTTRFYFGGRSGVGTAGIAVLQFNGKWRFDYNNTHSEKTTVTANEDKTGTITNDGSTFTSNSYCVIFSVNTNGTIDTRNTQYKFKSLEVWRDDTSSHYCVHRYMPAKNHEGIFGVMDTVAGGFYYDINNGNKYITGA